MDTRADTSVAQVVCPHCHTTNRVAGGEMAEAHCGKCGHLLFDGHPTAVSEADFDRHVTQSDVPVVVDYFADWCGPCKVMAPVYERVARDMEPRARFIKINTDEAQALAGRMRIRGIPTFAVMKGGREVARVSGAMSAGEFRAWVEAHAS